MAHVGGSGDGFSLCSSYGGRSVEAARDIREESVLVFVCECVCARLSLSPYLAASQTMLTATASSCATRVHCQCCCAVRISYQWPVSYEFD